MYNLKIALLIFFTLGLLVSCVSWKKYDYHSSAWQIEEVRPIEIPPGFDGSNIEEYYSVPYLGDDSSLVVRDQPPAKHIYQPPAKEYYPIPDVVHENMKHSESGEVPKRL